jgi:cytochrome b subunit of formate dehydrogenase
MSRYGIEQFYSIEVTGISLYLLAADADLWLCRRFRHIYVAYSIKFIRIMVSDTQLFSFYATQYSVQYYAR